MSLEFKVKKDFGGFTLDMELNAEKRSPRAFRCVRLRKEHDAQVHIRHSNAG